MATRRTTESVRNDSETPRTPGAWANRTCVYLHEDINVNDAETAVADAAESTTGTGEHRAVETEPTDTDLSNYYTKLELPEAQ